MNVTVQRVTGSTLTFRNVSDLRREVKHPALNMAGLVSFKTPERTWYFDPRMNTIKEIPDADV